MLALGRIGGGEAEGLLLADHGPIASSSGPVRGMTRLALGLLGTEAAAARLRADLGGGDPAAAAGAAAGMTLLPLLDEAGERALLDAVRSGPGDDTRRLALQALAVQGSSVNPRLMPAVLREVPRVFLAEQALLAAPDFALADDQNLLRRFLRLGGRFDEFPVGVEVRLLGPALLGGGGGARCAGRVGVPTISRQVDPGAAGVAAPPPDRASPPSPPSASGAGGGDAGSEGTGATGGTGRAGAGGDAGSGRLSPPGVRRPLGLGGVRTTRERFPNPLEQRLETAAALGLARLKPADRGFVEDATDELVELVLRGSTAGGDPSRTAMLLALGHLATEDREGVRALLLRYADGDEDDGGDRLLLPRATTPAGADEPSPAALERDLARSFGLLGSAVLVRRLSAGPDAVSVFPLRLSAHDDAELRREARRVFLNNASNPRLPRGVRLAAAAGLGLANDRSDPGGLDGFRPGGGLSFDPVAAADGDPLVLAGLLGSLEALAGVPAAGSVAVEEAERRVRARTDAFLDRVAAGSRDTPLTALGVAAARQVLRSLGHRPAAAAGPDAATLEALAAADPVLAVEAAAAGRWRNHAGMAGFFAGRLGGEGSDAVAAAWALGVLFDARSPSGLWRLERTANPVAVFRSDAPRLRLRPRGRVSDGSLLFRSRRWWSDPDAAMVLSGWPDREELAVANPFLATRWDEDLLGQGR